METKNIVATIYLKDGKAVKSFDDFTEVDNVYQLCQMYNDSGVDKILIFDLSTSDEEHEKNVNTIKNINRNLEIKVCAGGNINRMQDVKKLMYAGCAQVMLNAAKPGSLALAEEASTCYGKDRIVVSVHNVDFIYKHKTDIEDTFHELYILNPDIIDGIEHLTTVPYVVKLEEYNYDQILAYMSREKIRGISGQFIDDPKMDIMKLKSSLSVDGIKMDNFAPDLKWSDLRPNIDGIIPVIVQDYRTDEVLMLGYMNQEAFNTTINSGRMTYYNVANKSIYVMGETEHHYQYVKGLCADCGFESILAKVSTVGTFQCEDAKSAFVHNIVQKQYTDKNPLKVLESVYEIIEDRKVNPKVDSYTNHLFQKGMDEILKKVSEECTEILLATKNGDSESIKYEISDFLYYCMILMVEKGITWEEITTELAQR